MTPVPSLYSRRLLGLSILGLWLALALPAAAQKTVYQWKDAKGVTHFSDSPPPKSHTTRVMRAKDGTPLPTKAEPPVVDAQCATAQANLKQLQGTAPIGFDADKDGKVDRPLNTDERSAQTQYAEAAIKVHCAPAAAPAASDA